MVDMTRAVARRMRAAQLEAEFRLRGIEAINERLLRSTSPSAILRQFGARIAEDAAVHGPLIVHNAVGDYRNLTVESRAHVGRGVLLDLTCELRIGAEAVVSMGATILTHSDVGDRPLSERHPRQASALDIGPACYIGANATILAGCDVGTGAVVGAGAVVTKPVPPHEVAVGVPARLLAHPEASESARA
jgi:acetyltransferase-like isoleucine patch superfamily enzyme